MRAAWIQSWQLGLWEGPKLPTWALGMGTQDPCTFVWWTYGHI